MCVLYVRMVSRYRAGYGGEEYGYEGRRHRGDG